VKSMTARPSKIVPRMGVGEPTGGRYTREADADGKDWMGLVAALPCVLCTLLGVRQESRTTVHHARGWVVSSATAHFKPLHYVSSDATKARTVCMALATC